jgi:hypothetical protein
MCSVVKEGNVVSINVEQTGKIKKKLRNVISRGNFEGKIETKNILNL